jgi:hypothetical protein
MLLMSPTTRPSHLALGCAWDIESGNSTCETTHAVALLFNYVRDALYPATLMVTHQWAVKQATLVWLQVRFLVGPPGIQQPKTCLAKLYGEIYNDRKQRLVKAVLEAGYSVVVEHKDIPKPKSWKRNKHTFFLYHKRFVGHASETTEVTPHPSLRYHVIHPLTPSSPSATFANGPLSSSGKRMWKWSCGS